MEIILPVKEPLRLSIILSRQKILRGWLYFFFIDNMEIFIKTELQIVHKACTMKQEQVTST
jgi:hypothetical protein